LATSRAAELAEQRDFRPLNAATLSIGSQIAKRTGRPPVDRPTMHEHCAPISADAHENVLLRRREATAQNVRICH
jgi:hypothetical protein